jgi:polyhydroxyalkanoate synthesis regulator phasin
MGATAARVIGQQTLPDRSTQDRSACRGSTQAVGIVGADKSTPASHGLVELPACAATCPSLEISVDKVQLFLYSVAYAEQLNERAGRGVGSVEVQLAPKNEIESAARKVADELFDGLQKAMCESPNAVMKFYASLELRREIARAALQAKYEAAVSAGHAWAGLLKAGAVTCGIVNFAATVTLKVMSFIPGPTGLVATAVDIVASGVKEGAKDWYESESFTKAAAVTGSEVGSDLLKEFAEVMNELVADGSLNDSEKRKLEGVFTNYRGNTDKLQKQMENLIKEIQKLNSSGRKVRPDKIQKLEKLIVKLDGVKSSFRLGVMRNAKGMFVKGAGKSLSVYFFTAEILKAWKELQKQLD